MFEILFCILFFLTPLSIMLGTMMFRVSRRNCYDSNYFDENLLKKELVIARDNSYKEFLARMKIKMRRAGPDDIRSPVGESPIGNDSIRTSIKHTSLKDLKVYSYLDNYGEDNTGHMIRYRKYCRGRPMRGHPIV